MAGNEDVASVELATRIPKALHRDLKLHCVTTETAMMDFVTKAIEEKLRALGGKPTRTPKRWHGRAHR
jgi:hypothetical protein